MALQRPVSPRRSLLALLATLGLALAILPGISSAHDGREDGATTYEEDCPPALKKRLQRAGDNFGRGCDLAGGNLAQLDDSDAALAPGEVASSDNLSLIANLPKQGAFAPESAFNSDLAFKGQYAFAGNYNGFMVYDIHHPAQPKVVAQVVCPGSQNDISVWRNLLILSVDSSRSDDSCNSTSLAATTKEAWEGIRVFDITDPAQPQYVAAVETACGSHTHTLAPDATGRNLYVYVSSYNPSVDFPDCQPPHDRISIVKVPQGAPETASLAATPVLFPDGGMPPGGYSRETTGCHDITAYPQRNIAAGACMGNGILMDITDRTNPVVTEEVSDTENFAFWHSATFSNDGRKVVFTDELGGGGGPTCNPSIGPNRGADGIYDIVDGNLEFRSYYKIGRTQTNNENCVAHNGSLIPVQGSDLMVQAWYQGGISVFDFSDSSNPQEIAWFDRGPLSEERLILGGSWSAYWYNGYIYSNDIQKGFDVLKLDDPRVNKTQRMDVFNPQSQPSFNG
jgi:hypothetical protein